MADAISDRTLFTSFRDHADRCALSVTYPVLLQDVRHRSSPGSGSGSVEADLDYPCFQVYWPTHESFLDTEIGRERAIQTFVYVLYHLRSTGFFTLFRGIRFEVYDGQPGFRQHLETGKSNRGCPEAIGNHAVDERERRNFLGSFRSTLDRYIASGLGGLHDKMRLEGADAADIERAWGDDFQALDKICGSGALVSPDMARFNAWRRGCKKPNDRDRGLKRRKSLSDLDLAIKTPVFGQHRLLPTTTRPNSEPSANKLGSETRPRSKSSTSVSDLTLSGNTRDDTTSQQEEAHARAIGLQEIPSRETYIIRRMRTLADQLAAEFHAAITPSSFFNPGDEPYHSMVLILHSEDIVQDGLFIMRFGREPFMDNDEFPKSKRKGFDHRMQHVTVNSIGFRHQKSPDAGKVLGRHLHTLGLSKPHAVPKGIRPGFDADPSAWFNQKRSTSPGAFLSQEDVMVDEELESLLKDQDSDQHWPRTPESVASYPSTPEGKDEDEDLEMDIDADDWPLFCW